MPRRSKPYARDFLASDAVRLAETLRKETTSDGALTKGKNPEQLRKEAAAAADNADYKLAGKLAAAAVDRQSQRRRQLAATRPASPSRPTTRRPRSATICASAARPPPMPPISD